MESMDVSTSNSASTSPYTHSIQQNVSKVITNPSNDRPKDYDPNLEDRWSENEAAPSAPKGKGRVISDSEYDEDDAAGESSSDEEADTEEITEGAPSGGDENADVADKGDAFVGSKEEKVKSKNAYSSPASSPNPYMHPKIDLWEIDIDWSTYPSNISPKEMKKIRKNKKVLECAGQSSTASLEEIEWVMNYYDLEGKYVKPPPNMRPHRFDYKGYRIPRAVLTLKHIPPGVGTPLHSYHKDICEWFDVALIQLSPNSYKLAAALLILYKTQGFKVPSMKEFSYFFDIRSKAIGYYYLVVWPQHNKKGFSEGRVSNIKGGKKPFFYVFNTQRQRTKFNISPKVREHSKLKGEALARAQKISDLPIEQKSLTRLITQANLKAVGLFSKRVENVCPFYTFREGKKQKPSRIPHITPTITIPPSPGMSGVPNMFMDSELKVVGAYSTIVPETTAPSPVPEAISAGKKVSHKKRKLDKKKTADDGAHSKKRQMVVAAPSSSTSVLSSTFVQLAEKHGDIVALQEWQARSEEDQKAAIKHATLELCFHNLTQVENLNVHQSRLQELEKERNVVTKECKDLKKKLKKLEEDKATDVSSIAVLKNEVSKLEKTIADRDVSLTTLNDTISKLSEENKNLKADHNSGWADEKNKIESAAFEDGFRSYLKTFMVAVLNFDWSSSFGEGMGKWMATFASKEAAAIAQKKIQLQVHLEEEKAQLKKEKACTSTSAHHEAETNNKEASDKDVSDDAEGQDDETVA